MEVLTSVILIPRFGTPELVVIVVIIGCIVWLKFHRR